MAVAVCPRTVATEESFSRTNEDLTMASIALRFGALGSTTSYDSCVYDESGRTPTLVVSVTAPAGGTCSPPSKNVGDQFSDESE